MGYSFTEIPVPSSLLKEEYGVFIIKVKKGVQLFLFVGTTGSKSGIDAMSLLQKLTMHLKLNRNAEYTLYHRLMRALKIKKGEAMDAWLRDAAITLQFFKTDDVKHLDDYKQSDAIHKEKILKELSMQEAIIKELSKKFKKNRILNLQKKKAEQQKNRTSEALIKDIVKKIGI